MRILVTSDWHVGITSFGVLDDCGRNSRLLDVANTIEKISTFAREQRVDMLVHCGDVFHTNRPTTAEQLIFLRFLQQMEEAEIRTRIIIGNHDYNSQLGKGNALKLFKELPFAHVRIFDQTTSEAWPATGDDKHLFIFYPFGGEEPDITSLVTRERSHRTFLICHSHLEGAVVGAEPFEIRDDKATKFSELPVDGVFAGHFHKPQLLGERPLAFYPGSIQPVDFNERNDIKGVVLVDTEELTLHPAGFKTRRLVQYDFDKPHVLSRSLSEAKDSIVKINITLTESEAHKFDENQIRDAAIEAGAHSIASINLIVQREQVKRDPSIKIDSDVKSNFLRFLAQKDYGDLSDSVRQTGLSVIEECAS